MLNNIGRQVGRAGVGAAMLLTSLVPSQGVVAKTPKSSKGDYGADLRDAVALCLRRAARGHATILSLEDDITSGAYCAQNSDPSPECLGSPMAPVSATSVILKCADTGKDLEEVTSCITEDPNGPTYKVYRDIMRLGDYPLAKMAQGEGYAGRKPVNLATAVDLLRELGDDKPSLRRELLACTDVVAQDNDKIKRLRKLDADLTRANSPKIETMNARIKAILDKLMKSKTGGDPAHPEWDGFYFDIPGNEGD